jgi:hypothetical protein
MSSEGPVTWVTFKLIMYLSAITDYTRALLFIYIIRIIILEVFLFYPRSVEFSIFGQTSGIDDETAKEGPMY